MSGRPPKRGGAAYNLRLVLDELEKINRRLKRIERKIDLEETHEHHPRINLEAHLVKGITQ
jgi:hypothetical protein